MRYQLTATAGLVAALLSPALRAQEFGAAGDVSFAADRLTGIYFVDEGADGTVIALGGSPWYFAHPYTTARLGIDFFIIDQLSLGGSLGIHFVSDDDDGPRDNDATGFLFAPRVGYVLNFNDTFGFWPRGGFTFRTFDDNGEFALTLEAPFFAVPGDQWGFTFGPTLDAGLTGDGPEALVFSLVAGGVFGFL